MKIKNKTKYLMGIMLFILLFSVSCASVPVIQDKTESTLKAIYRIYENYDGNYNPERIPKEWVPYEWYPCPGGQNHIHVNMVPSEYNKEPFSGYIAINGIHDITRECYYPYTAGQSRSFSDKGKSKTGIAGITDVAYKTQCKTDKGDSETKIAAMINPLMTNSPNRSG